MSYENGSSNSSPNEGESGDFALWEQELSTDNFALWGQELSAENSARLTIELGEAALGQLVAIEQPPESYPVEDYLRLEKSPRYDNALPEKATSRSGDFRLTGDEMCQIALGLIYFTTGVPTDELYE